MAQDIINENQKISYTNLDFSAIYTETLDLIKQLTYKWDPSISDESDPGVILVKLSALLADKLNYNIDKNILETFPLSVTQDGNARQLYDQLGYYMDWYISGQTDVAINWVGENNPNSSLQTYRIPKFTPICDTEQSSNKRFTIIGVEGAEDNIVSDILITNDGATVVALVMEGFPVQYQFEGETVITSQMVDPISHRLYFTTKYISQNGIFIKNTNQDNYAEWKRVNNLYENTYNELRYIFGYDSQTDTCYLEFPDNYAELIGSGIEITYLIIDPTGGEVKPQELTQFMAPISTTVTVDDVESVIQLNNDNVRIINYLASSGHSDIEGINEAYVNYKRTVGTFKTLITLRDFLNYIRNEDLNVCSNAFVCDRTNDVQSVYKIMNKGKDLTNLIVKVEKLVKNQSSDSVFNYTFTLSKDSNVVSGKTYYLPSENGETLEPVENPSGSPAYKRYYELSSRELDTDDALEAFTLKFYMLRKSISVNSLAAYNQTFTMLDPYPDFDTLFADTSHLEHTYGEILPVGKNYFKKSTDEEWSDTKSYWLYNTDTNTYSLITKLEDYISGDAPVDMEKVYDIKIEALMPHVIFFKTLYPVEMNVSTYNVLDADTQEIIRTNIIDALYSQTSSSEMNFGDEVSVDYLANIVKESDTRIKSVAISPINYYLYATYFDDDQEAYIELYIDDDMSIFSPESYQSSTSIVASQIKKDIVAKSILAGVTQLIIPDDEFVYHLPQKHLLYRNDIVRVEPEAEIDISTASTSYSVSNNVSTIRKTYTLKENEKLTFFKPHLIDTDTFLSGVHYEYSINSIIEANQSYKLKDNEYFIFYLGNKEEAGNSIESYTAHAFGPETIITSSFAIPRQADVSSLSNFARSQIIPQFELASDLSRFTETTANNTYMTEIRNSSSIINNTISGTDSIRINIIDIADIEISDKFKFFWMLNKPTYFSKDNNRNYVLFGEYNSEEDSKYYDDINSYTLKSGEILFYTDEKFTEGNTIGSGCTLIRNCGVESSQYGDPLKNTIYFAEVNHLSSIVPNSSFSTLTDSNDVMRPREQGLYETHGATEQRNEEGDEFNPFELGLYEAIGNPDAPDYYIPSKDTTNDGSKRYFEVEFVRTNDVTAVPIKDYYVLVMRKESGYFRKSDYIDSDGIPRTTYVIDELDSGCFEEVNIKDFDDPKVINPVDEGWYKEITYNNKPFYDTYSLAEDIEETTQPRFTHANTILSKGTVNSRGNEYLENDSTVFNRKILADTIYKNIDISNKNTYVDMDLALDNFSPVNQKLLVPTKYATYYADNGGNPSDNPVEVNYLTNPFMDRLWIEDENHEKHKCYSLDTDEDASYVHFSPKIEELKASTDAAVFSEMESKFDTDVSKVGWYYKPNTLGTVYKAGVTQFPYLSVNRVEESSISPLNHLYSLYIASIPYYPIDADPEDQNFNPTKALDYIHKNWQTTVSFQSPYESVLTTYNEESTYSYDDRVYLTEEENGEIKYKYYKCSVTTSTPGAFRENEWTGIDISWRTATFVEDTGHSIGEQTVNRYIVVDANTIIDKQINLGVIYPKFITSLEESINPSFYVEARFANALDIHSGSLYEKTSEVGESLDSDFKLASLFPNNSNRINDYAIVQLYFMPKLYKFNDFVRYTDIKYYKLKSLYRQNCGTIDPWSCVVKDTDDVLKNLNDTIGKDYQSLQPDTSLTIVQNDSYVDDETTAIFSEGDKVIFEVDDTSEETVTWPVFNNKEVNLDLDKYRVYFIKNGDSTLKEIKSLNIDNYSWKSYSSLMVNTSSKSGQRLSENHTIDLYNSEDSIEAVEHISGEIDKNVSIQFRDSVPNQTGSYIDVTTADSKTKEAVPNAVYVFEPYNEGTNYKYNSVDYSTSILFNTNEVGTNELGENVYGPQIVEIPFGLPGGEYLLGGFMKSGVNLTVTHNNYLTVNGETYNLDSPVVNDGNTYAFDSNYINKLHSYMDETREVFTGDRYDYIYTNTGDGSYRKLIAPSLIAVSSSPATLKWYENNNGEFELSTKTEIGTELLIEAPAEIGMNPKELGWYEKIGNNYILTDDTVVSTEEGEINKTYYMEPELYVDISEVDSSLEFEIDINNKPVNYTFDDIFKLEPNSAIGDFNAIKKKVQQLDYDEEYAYTYVPSDNDKIANPLNAKSFYNPNHIYNKFTIPQLDFENLDIKFTTIRNNR